MKPEIKKFLKEASLTEDCLQAMKFLVDSIEGEINQFTDKSYLIEGDPGIGKTYFVEHLIKLVDFPVFYLGPFNLENKNVRTFNNLKQIMERLSSMDEGIIYIDDLQNSLEFENNGGDRSLTDAERKRFLSLLETVKRSNKKIFLIMTVNDVLFMEDSWMDRIETKINLLEPSEKSKKEFLKNKYSNLMGKRIIKEIASKTIGYNFRNLDEVVRSSYRFGEGAISMKSVNKAISLYTPSGLASYHLEYKTKLRFSDVIGQNEIKRELSKIRFHIKNKKRLDKLQIKSNNLIIFSGVHGIGKTYMARALAGELKVPLINIGAMDLYVRHANPFRGISKIIDTARRYKNCVIFIDEADKLMGMDAYSLEEEGPILSEFNKQVESMQRSVESVIILSVNNLTRLGKAMKDRFSIIEFNKPSFEDREEFIKKMIERSEINIPLDTQEIARKTEGKNYRDLQRLWNNLVFYYLEKGEIDSEFIEELFNEKTSPSPFGKHMGMYG